MERTWGNLGDAQEGVEVQFTANVVNTLNGVVYAVFDNMLEINKQREVSIDF